MVNDTTGRFPDIEYTAVPLLHTHKSAMGITSRRSAISSGFLPETTANVPPRATNSFTAAILFFGMGAKKSSPSRYL